LATTVGTAAIGGLTLWRQTEQDTDLKDPTVGITASAKAVEAIEAPPIRFRDVARAVGIRVRHGPGQRNRILPEDTGSGLAWGDYDGDGDWDLYVVNFSAARKGARQTQGSNRLYRNDGGHFTDVTETARVGDAGGFGMGATFADFDNDGLVDLYVTNWGPNRLFHNQGDGTFVEIAQQAGVADSHWSTGVAWGDYDRDGRLDLYVCNYVDYDLEDLDMDQLAETSFGSHTVPFTLNPNSFDPVPNRLYRNRGDGTFAQVAERTGVSNPTGRSLAATFCDLDGDGWLDLYVNNDVSTNKLFRNMLGEFNNQSPRHAGGLPRPENAVVGRDGRTGTRVDRAAAGAVAFVDLSAITGTADPRGSMGLAVGEIGGIHGRPDGLPDLFITHWVAQENALYQSLRLPGGNVEYRDKTRQFRLGEISIDTVGWGTALVDLDLDGRVDLAVANGSTLERPDDPKQLTAEPLFLCWNNGRRFVNIAPAAGRAASARYCARGLAAADYDNDGDIDLAIAVNRAQPLLLRNETKTKNRSLKVLLRGPSAACFGASVQLITNDGANGGASPVVHSGEMWYGADVSFLSMHAPELVFGLGTRSVADRLIVHWADGKESILSHIEPGRVEVVYPRTGGSAAE